MGQLLVTSRGIKLSFQENDNFISQSVAQTGQWEEGVAKALERHLLPNDVFLDIGAHIGYFSTLAARLCKQVIAIEADPTIAEILKENLHRNSSFHTQLIGKYDENHPVVISLAVSDFNGDAYLTTDEKDSNNPGASYLGDSGVKIGARRLEDMVVDRFGWPDVVKIDVEGLEYRILNDSPNVLDNARVIIFEASPAQYARYDSNIENLIELLEWNEFHITDTEGNPARKITQQLEDWQYTNFVAVKSPIAEWVKANPQTPEEIKAFYKDSKYYINELNEWHARDETRRYQTQLIVAAARACGAQRILDIGAGAGHDLEALREQSDEYSLIAIEPNEVLANHLINNIRCDAVINSFEDLDETAKNFNLGPPQWDMIICVDVLEHVSDPEEEILKYVVKYLKMGGIFIEATATHDTATPLHLESLRGWSPARYLDRYGFSIVEEYDRFRIWQRIAEKRSNEESLLLCAYRSVGVQTTGKLLGLAKSGGWRIHIHSGDALISRVRSIAVSSWLQEDDADVFLMIDDDIVFNEADAHKVIALAREKRSIVSGAYPVRGPTHTASRFIEGDISVRFGDGEPPRKIKWAGTGFIAVHRDVVQAIVDTMPLTLADRFFFWPMFMPFVVGNEYLSEDWAFCERARQLGFDVWLDPTVILTHIGGYGFTVYDIGENENAQGN